MEAMFDAYNGYSGSDKSKEFNHFLLTHPRRWPRFRIRNAHSNQRSKFPMFINVKKTSINLNYLHIIKIIQQH